MQDIYRQFITGLRSTTALEYIAVFCGIGSVWFSRIEHIFVYPVGLVSTLIYIYLSFKYHLFGEAVVNLFYSIMSVYGWILWTKRDRQRQLVLRITRSSPTQWMGHLLFFGVLYLVFFFTLLYLKNAFAAQTIPAGDAFATSTAFTGMLLMAKKKVESWYWWIATNTASVPLYFAKNLVFTSLFYLILLVMAFWGLAEWQRRYRLHSINA